LAGCATAAPVAQVDRQIESVTQEVEVCGDADSPGVGQPVRFRRRSCAPLNAKSSVLHCAVADIARGEVIRVVDKRCAVVRVAGGVGVQAGDIIADDLSSSAQR
jgi:hypothetical protein